MGALVLADPGGGAHSGSGRRYALPALLILGWIGLFAYSAAYLTEDLPFRSQPPEATTSADAAAQRAPSSRIVMLDTPDLPTLATPPETKSAPAPSVPATPAPAPLPIARPAPASAPISAEYVGVWGPTPEACGSRSRRRGYIPATITQDRARAGRTVCTFHDTRRSGSAWITSAECSDRGRHWSSQVRLTVEGDHLTWSSSRGTSAYIRCSRRAG
jgi:hypothetical protein